MATNDQQHSSPEAGAAIAALGGLRAWVITDGKAGSESVALGLATRLGLNHDLKRVNPQGLARHLAPFGNPDRRDRFGQSGSTFAPPFPDIAVGIGRRSMPYLRAVKRAKPACVTVALLDSKGGLGVADIIWVPHHDTLRGKNVITSLTSPHPFSPERLAALRASPPDKIAALPRPRLAVLLGGQNPVYRYGADDHARFEAGLRALSATAGSVMLTPSRRTHAALLEAATRATVDCPRMVHAGDGPNPYADFLAHSDSILTTGDSVSMVGEAAATGVPVLVFHPSEGSSKFRRFHEALTAAGITAPLQPEYDCFPNWGYDPLDATTEVARQIAERAVALRGGSH